MVVAPLAAAVALALAGAGPPPGSPLAIRTLASLGPMTPRVADPALAGALALDVDRKPGSRRKAWSCPIEYCPPPNRVGLSLPPPRPRRTEIFLALVARSGVEPVATVAAHLAVFPLRVQWWPPTVQEQAGLVRGANRLGHVVVLLRWSIDARNMPVLALER
jgi:hypothetical protein